MSIILFRIFYTANYNFCIIRARKYENIQYNGHIRLRLAKTLKESLYLEDTNNIFYNSKGNSIYVILNIDGDIQTYIDKFNNPPIFCDGMILLCFSTEKKKKQVRRYDILNRNLAIYKTSFLLNYNDELTDEEPPQQIIEEMKQKIITRLRRDLDTGFSIDESNLPSTMNMRVLDPPEGLSIIKPEIDEYDAQPLNRDNSNFTIDRFSFTKKKVSNNKEYIFVRLAIILDNCSIIECHFFKMIRNYVKTTEYSLVSSEYYQQNLGIYADRFHISQDGFAVVISGENVQTNTPLTTFHSSLVVKIQSEIETLFKDIGFRCPPSDIRIFKDRYSIQGTRILRVNFTRFTDKNDFLVFKILLCDFFSFSRILGKYRIKFHIHT